MRLCALRPACPRDCAGVVVLQDCRGRDCALFTAVRGGWPVGWTWSGPCRRSCAGRGRVLLLIGPAAPGSHVPRRPDPADPPTPAGSAAGSPGVRAGPCNTPRLSPRAPGPCFEERVRTCVSPLTRCCRSPNHGARIPAFPHHLFVRQRLGSVLGCSTWRGAGPHRASGAGPFTPVCLPRSAARGGQYTHRAGPPGPAWPRLPHGVRLHPAAHACILPAGPRRLSLGAAVRNQVTAPSLAEAMAVDT